MALSEPLKGARGRAPLKGYSFPEVNPVEARLKRCVHLASVLRTADIPVLRAELHARLAEGEPTIADALRGVGCPGGPRSRV